MCDFALRGNNSLLNTVTDLCQGRCPDFRCGLKYLGNMWSFPSRYVGAKTWSIPGCIYRGLGSIFRRVFYLESVEQTFMQKLCPSQSQVEPRQLTIDEAKHHLKFVSMAAFVHANNAHDWMIPWGYTPISPDRNLEIKQTEIQQGEICLFDPQTGLKIVLAEKDNQVLIAFGAVGSYKSELKDERKCMRTMVNQYAGGFGNLIGLQPSLFEKADRLLKEIRKSPYLQGKEMILVGQCLGGAIAQYLSMKHQIPSYCYNSLPIGPGLQQRLGADILKEAPKYVTHVYVETDPLNDSLLVSLLDQSLSRLGMRTPGNFGKCYFIPSAYAKTSEAHSYAAGSFMQYVGYSKNSKPSELQADFK